MTTSHQPPDEPLTARELRPPTDPWAAADTDTAWHGAAAVPALPDATLVEQQVIFVERPRRRRWPWVVGTLALLTLVCCGAAVALTAPIRAQHPATVTIPDEVAGLRVVTGQDIDRETDRLELEIRQQFEVDEAFARVLEDPDAPERPVYLFGATRLILDPPGDLTKAMRDIANASEIRTYDPGELGGHLRCGNHIGEDGARAVACAWIDYGSIGVGLFPGGRPMDECAALLSAIRSAVLARP